MSKNKITPNTTWEETTMGGTIYDAGNAQEFETGDWRSKKPIFLREKCHLLKLPCAFLTAHF